MGLKDPNGKRRKQTRKARTVSIYTFNNDIHIENHKRLLFNNAGVINADDVTPVTPHCCTALYLDAGAEA